MFVLIFFLLIILANIIVYKKAHAWPLATIFSALIALVGTVCFQIFAMIQLGYLDPFFIIAFVVLFSAAFSIGLVVRFILNFFTN